MSWRDRILAAAAFLCFFSGALQFINGPAATPQQAYFRIGLAVVGILLGVIVIALKASGRK